jgi:hypothetical protein
MISCDLFDLIILKNVISKRNARRTICRQELEIRRRGLEILGGARRGFEKAGTPFKVTPSCGDKHSPTPSFDELGEHEQMR